jgi:hypothetical protein
VERAQAVAEAVGDLGPDEVLAVPTPHGDVHIDRLEVREDNGVSYVDVWLAGNTESGEANYRIVNPPLLVPDPAGDIVTGAGRMRRDPAAAVATVIASLGGARANRKDRR